MDIPDPMTLCATCGEKCGDHHKKTCKHWGQVLPSECSGLIEWAIAEVLSKQSKRDK